MTGHCQHCWARLGTALKDGDLEAAKVLYGLMDDERKREQVELRKAFEGLSSGPIGGRVGFQKPEGDR